MKRLIQIAVTTVCTTVACSDPLLEVQTITDLRVLGARLGAEADARDASLVPGRGANLEWLVVSNEATTYSAAVSVCASVETTMGVPTCSDEPFYEDSGRFETNTAATFAFTPPELPIGSPWLALFVACKSGQARFARDGSGRCSGGAVPREASFDGTVGEENLNPSLSDDSIELDGAPWTSEAFFPTGTPCRDQALPALRVVRPSSVRFELGGDDREDLPQEVTAVYGAEPTESLSYAHFLTTPGLERPFSGIASESPDTTFDIAIDLEGKLPRAGVVSDFHLIVRDGRGGSDWTRRQICALP